MQLSMKRVLIAQDTMFQNRLVILALEHAHDIMNVFAKDDDQDLKKLQAKAVELINNPEEFRKRLAWSVAALLLEEDVTTNVSDFVLQEDIRDCFDAMAGVTKVSQ